jgi:hypothetical protein
LTDLAAEQQSQPEPERRAGRTCTSSYLDVDAVQAFENPLKVLITAGQLGGCRHPIEIIRFERRYLIRAPESVIRVFPRATSVAFTAVFKSIHHNRVEPNHMPAPCSSLA